MDRLTRAPSRLQNGGANVSFPFEILLGYGAMAVICERCGKDVVTPGSRVCPKCEEESVESPADSLEEPEDDA